MFITFEGIDGSGKTTLINKLNEVLKKEGYKVFLTSEPIGNKILDQELNFEYGQKIKEIILNENSDELSEFLLFSAFRNIHINRFIKKMNKDKNIILCDRFIHSSIVYQGIVGGLDLNFINLINQKIFNNLEIDFTFILDINEKKAIERVGERNSNSDKFDSNTIEKYKDIRHAYLSLKNKYDYIEILDAEKEIEENVKLIIKMIKNKMIV